MHIDRHYDLQDSFLDEDLNSVKTNPKLSYEEFSNLMRQNGQYKVFRWDTYIMAGFVLHTRWFHSNVFITQGQGNKEPGWMHDPLPIREENPLYMEWHIQRYIGAKKSDYIDGFKSGDYKLQWIVNLDLDVFFTEGDNHIQLFSDDYIRHVAAILQKCFKRIAVLTISVSPECLGGKDQKDKWENGFRILRVLSEKLECLKTFETDRIKATE